MMTKRHALAMIALARRAGATVVVGGPDPPHYAAEYLDAGADVVVIGEGEQTLEELLPALLQRRPGRAARAIVTASPSQAQLTVVGRDAHRARALLPDLDAQPFPDRAGDRSRRATCTPGASITASAPVSLITARGCPYTCTWCSRSVFGTTHRRRSVANVADEVEAIVDRYHPDRLWYADDVFAIHRGVDAGRTRASWSSGGLRLPFECISRAERIDDAVADALAELGCWRVWIGSESGSQRMLDAMQRASPSIRCASAPQRLRRRGIQVGMFIMLGYDGEQMRISSATVEHLKRTAPDMFLTTVSYPIKGTPYYDARRRSNASRARPWDRAHRSRSGDSRPAGAPLLRLRPPLDHRRGRARDQHWQRGRYARAARAASSALVGRARHDAHRALERVDDRPLQPVEHAVAEEAAADVAAGARRRCSKASSTTASSTATSRPIRSATISALAERTPLTAIGVTVMPGPQLQRAVHGVPALKRGCRTCRSSGAATFRRSTPTCA